VQWILLILLWLLIFMIPLLFGDFKEGVNWQHVTKIWKEYSLLFLIFLANRFVLMPHLFLKGKRSFYFITIAMLIIIMGALAFLIDGLGQMPVRGHHPPPNDMPGDFNQPGIRGPGEFIPPFANLLIMSILLVGFDSGLLFFSKWIHSEQNKLRTEKESIKNKMAFLQNQVSPHFFMNTLNNIHSLVDIDTEEAKESIIRLSQMMSYMLYDTQTNRILLEKEIEFIQSFVELMSLRYPEEVDIVLDVPTEIPKIMVPPLLTISFIENAFKYGISYESDSFVHILIKVINNRFFFSIFNSNYNSGQQKNKSGSGIGIENVKSRLALIYDRNYHLEIKDDDDVFKVNLNIPV